MLITFYYGKLKIVLPLYFGMIRENIYLKPRIYYVWIKKASELLLGSHIGYEFNQKTKISDVYAAFYVRGGIERNTDAAIFAVGFDHNNWNFCFIYDYDISGLHVTTSRSNAFELSVIYIRPETFVKRKSVPCMIF